MDLNKSELHQLCAAMFESYRSAYGLEGDVPVVQVETDENIEIYAMYQSQPMQLAMAQLGASFSKKRQKVLRVSVVAGAYMIVKNLDKKTGKMIEQPGGKKECIVISTMDYKLQPYAEIIYLKKEGRELKISGHNEADYKSVDLTLINIFWQVYAKIKALQNN